LTFVLIYANCITLMISNNIVRIKGLIDRAAQKRNRNPGDIRFVCVTKGRSPDQIREAARCGVADVGENRVQEAKGKYQLLKDINIRWHMVGHLQTNKVKDAVRMFDLIHSVDSLKLAKEIDAQAAKINKLQDVLIEVNASGEETKFGAPPPKALDLVKDMIGLQHIKLLGLMTMAPFVKDKEATRPSFRKLRQLQVEINNFLSTVNYEPSTVLSMGMSHDYEVAVEEGATMVRIGTAIFEEQNR